MNIQTKHQDSLQSLSVSYSILSRGISCTFNEQNILVILPPKDGDKKKPATQGEIFHHTLRVIQIATDKCDSVSEREITSFAAAFEKYVASSTGSNPEPLAIVQQIGDALKELKIQKAIKPLNELKELIYRLRYFLAYGPQLVKDYNLYRDLEADYSKILADFDINEASKNTKGEKIGKNNEIKYEPIVVSNDEVIKNEGDRLEVFSLKSSDRLRHISVVNANMLKNHIKSSSMYDSYNEELNKMGFDNEYTNERAEEILDLIIESDILAQDPGLDPLVFTETKSFKRHLAYLRFIFVKSRFVNNMDCLLKFDYLFLLTKLDKQEYKKKITKMFMNISNFHVLFLDAVPCDMSKQNMDCPNISVKKTTCNLIRDEVHDKVYHEYQGLYKNLPSDAAKCATSPEALPAVSHEALLPSFLSKENIQKRRKTKEQAFQAEYDQRIATLQHLEFIENRLFDSATLWKEIQIEKIEHHSTKDLKDLVSEEGPNLDKEVTNRSKDEENIDETFPAVQQQNPLSVSKEEALQSTPPQLKAFSRPDKNTKKVLKENKKSVPSMTAPIASLSNQEPIPSYQSHDFHDWLKKLDPKLKEVVLRCIHSLQRSTYGDISGLDTSLRLYEARIHMGGGIRLYFTNKNGAIYFLLGGDKNTQKKDIEKAKDSAQNLFHP